MLVEDCGPCTQIVINMAREAHVSDAQIEAVLRADATAMSTDVALGFRFANAIALRSTDEDEARQAVRTRWGDKGVIDLTLALERLSPAERGAFLLHDVFDMPSADVAAILGKSAAACRQLATRARKAVHAARPIAPTPAATHARLFAAFLNAVASGDVTRLAALLREDAVMLSDSGGLKPAAHKPILGADKIARFFIGITKKADHYSPGNRSGVWSYATCSINGATGLLLYFDGVLEQTLTIDVDGEKIAAIYSVRNPEKLAGLADPDRHIARSADAITTLSSSLLAH